MCVFMAGAVLEIFPGKTPNATDYKGAATAYTHIQLKKSGFKCIHYYRKIAIGSQLAIG